MRINQFFFFNDMNSYNLKKVLKFTSRLEKSFYSVKVR